MADRILWNDDWEFCKCQYKEGKPEEPLVWEKVKLPHDWLIYDTQHLYENSVGWYRKIFFNEQNKQLQVLRFDGVYMDTVIYVNGIEAGSWKYGYSAFEIDITRFLVHGYNQIVVRVIHIAPNSRWYSGAGIYRNVWLLKMSTTHIKSDGVYITPIERGAEWRVEIDTEICRGKVFIDKIKQIILDNNGNIIVSDCLNLKINDYSEGEILYISQAVMVRNPLLWDIGQGNLYTLKTQLLAESTVIDEEKQFFGFKTVVFTSDKGLYLNGRRIKIQGVAEHHDLGCLGAAFNKTAMRRKLEILRKMGVNAIRTAHNMPDKAVMELADEMGFLVNSEGFDIWRFSKTKYDYARFFQEWIKKDVASWIRRDRNHVSLLMWSIGNEIYDIHANEQGYLDVIMLQNEVLKHDYKGHAPVTFASNYLRWERAQKCADILKIVGYNYGEDLYSEHHKKHSDWIIYGSETASMLASRNVYHFPLEVPVLCEDDEQCSALGNCCAGWGAHNYKDNIIADRDADYSLGQFVWSGFDYFGEPTPYNTRNCYFGQIDTAGFPKDAFYIYQAEWTNYKENPMIHIFPYWDFNENQLIDVCVCSNAPKIELFLNGVSQGNIELDHVHGMEFPAHWKIPYVKGELCAKAYDMEGKVIAEERKHSFQDAVVICMMPDKWELSNDGQDLIFVEITVKDKDNHLVENANNRIHIEVVGAGRLIGIDNGDSTDFDQVKGTSKRLFGGKLLAVIAARNGHGGKINVCATSPGLKSAEIVLCVNGYVTEAGIEENQEYPVVAGGIGGKIIPEGIHEIPIRKITLVSEGELLLNAEKKELSVRAIISPHNASYHDLEWKIVNDKGIQTDIAIVNAKENIATVVAQKDGNFYLRCIAKNGGTVASVRSHLLITVQGLGVCTLNPYEKHASGICTNRTEGIVEGIDHGIRFLGKKMEEIQFEFMDFGPNGTNEISMELFKYGREPISFQIWEGNGKGKLLLEDVFKEEAGWMEFKKKTYVLKHKIQGIKKITISSAHDFQIRSLWFKPFLRGTELNCAIDNDEIFGDFYVITQDAVTEIGNNVTIVFQEMDFGENGVSRLIINGRCLHRNSIQVKFLKDSHTKIELIEYDETEEYKSREFPISTITGKNEVQFVFLPGSQFDFKWFKFTI